MNAHEFALYVPHLNVEHPIIKIIDSDIIHRMVRVLRLQVRDSLLLFDRISHAQARIMSIDKKSITCEQISYYKNKSYSPKIVFLLPLLKRDAFEHAWYTLVSTGIQHIQPVITTKSQHAWGGNKQKERLERISIAAAEQSKNFAFPVVKEPIDLQDAIHESADYRLFFDAQGDPFLQQIKSIERAQSIMMLIGPEADLASEEKQLLKKSDFMVVKLTPTILRAQDAAGVASGMIRTITQK